MKSKLPLTHIAIVALCVVVGLFLYQDSQRQESMAAVQRYQQQMNAVYTLDKGLQEASIESLISDRVIDLPEDGQAFYLTVFTNAQPTPKERMLLSWFQSDTVLASLKAQTHWNHYTPEVAMYRTRFASAVPQSDFPSIMLQGPDGAGNHGKVYFKRSANAIPDSPRELVALIRDAIRRPCPCPNPQPTPSPTPQPNPNPIPQIPDLGPPPPSEVVPPAPEEKANVLGLAAIVALVVGVLAGWNELKNRVRN